MPVVHSLSKVQKNIQKSKGAMHPKGRKFKQLNRATLRENKINRRKVDHVERKEHEMQRVLFFKEAVNSRPDQNFFPLDELKLIIEMFLSRDDDEIEELQSKRKKNRPPTNRLLLLENKRKAELAEYESGYLIPNVNDPSSLEFLRAWNGTSGGVNQVKNIRISKSDTELPSSLENVNMEE
jgi:translation machinery-associated protein 16